MPSADGTVYWSVDVSVFLDPDKTRKSTLRVDAVSAGVDGLVLVPAVYEYHEKPHAYNFEFKHNGECCLTHLRSGRKVEGPFPTNTAAREFAEHLRGFNWNQDVEDMDVRRAKEVLQYARRQVRFAAVS